MCAKDLYLQKCAIQVLEKSGSIVYSNVAIPEFPNKSGYG